MQSQQEEQQKREENGVSDQVRTTKQINVKPELIKRSRYQTRVDMFEDPEDIAKLAENIRKNKLLNMPLVRADPDEKDKYELIGGHRRTNAMVNVLRWSTIPCRLVEDMDELDVFKTVLSENLQESPLTHYEEGKAFKILREEFHLTIDRIAQNLDRSVDLVRDRLELVDEMDQARDAYDAPDYYKYVLRVTQPQREEVKKLYELGNRDYVRQGIKKVIEGTNIDALRIFVQACERASKAGNRNVTEEIKRVIHEEERRKRADAVQATYKWYEAIGKKIPKDLKPEFEKGKARIEWLASEHHEAKELKETLDKYLTKKRVTCPKCLMDFSVSQASQKNKTFLLLKPRDKKLEKKSIAIQLTLD